MSAPHPEHGWKARHRARGERPLTAAALILDTESPVTLEELVEWLAVLDAAKQAGEGRLDLFITALLRWLPWRGDAQVAARLPAGQYVALVERCLALMAPLLAAQGLAPPDPPPLPKLAQRKVAV